MFCREYFDLFVDMSFETKIGFEQAYQFQKEHGHVLRKSRWKDITARVMIDVG